MPIGTEKGIAFNFDIGRIEVHELCSSVDRFYRVRKHCHQFLGMRRTNHRLSSFQASATVSQVLRIEGYDQEGYRVCA